MADVLQQLNGAVATLVERVQGSLVQISNGRRGVGAGTVWQSDGLIVTNAHVVRRQTPQVTLADGRVLPARVLGTDTSCDLAALVVAAHHLPAVEHCAVWPLRQGQWVLALGHPWGVPSAATAGVVIDVGVPLEMPHSQREWIQASIHVRPGHSGGPLVDAQGHLVGIITMMAGPDVGLAVPLPTVTAFLHRVLEAA